MIPENFFTETIVVSKGELIAIFREESRFLLDQIRLMLKEKQQVKKMGAKEAAMYLGVSLSTLYKRVNEVPHRKIWKEACL